MTSSSTSETSPWRNRIVGYSDEPPDQLLASPMNWRIHPKNQQDALLGVLREAGIVQNILVNRTTGNLIDGHLRVSLALREGQPTVPVTWVELSKAEEQLILATIDPLAALAVADKEKLESLLRDTKPADAALQQFLSELAVKEGLSNTVIVPDPDPPKDPTLPGECLVELYCTAEDLDEFRGILEAWGERPGVTLHISA